MLSKCHLFTLPQNSLQHRTVRLRGWLGIEKSRCGSHRLKTLFSKWLPLISWAVSTAMLCFPAAHGICINQSWVSISPIVPGTLPGERYPQGCSGGTLLGATQWQIPHDSHPWRKDRAQTAPCSLFLAPGFSLGYGKGKIKYFSPLAICQCEAGGFFCRG